MGRIYSVSYNGTLTASGGDADLLELLPAANKPVKLLGFILSQTSETQDAEEKALRISVLRMTATVTSGNGTSVTPAPVDSADVAAGATAECNGATVATTSGSTVTLAEMGWNVRQSPFDFWFRVGCEPKAKNAEGLFVRSQTTPGNDISIQFTAWIEEE